MAVVKASEALLLACSKAVGVVDVVFLYFVKYKCNLRI